MTVKGLCIVVSAPSGAGKTSIVKALCAPHNKMVRAVSYTTRSPRANEKDGVDYHFVSQSAFDALVAEEGFLEYAQVFDHCYGTPKKEVVASLEAGHHVLVDIDWQGAAQLRQGGADVVSIFILPPSLHALEERLRLRKQDDGALIMRRMSKAISEISHYQEYDYLVLNDDLDQAVLQCQSIILSEQLRLHRQKLALSETLDNLLR